MFGLNTTPKPTKATNDVDPEFEKLVEEILQEFRDNDRISEMPFPQNLLSKEETACIWKIAEQMLLNVEEKSDGDSICIRFFKTSSPKE